MNSKKDDAILVKKYINDPEIKKLLHAGVPYLYTLEDEKKWYESCSAQNDTYSFAIETLEEKKYIGGVVLIELIGKIIL